MQKELSIKEMNKLMSTDDVDYAGRKSDTDSLYVNMGGFVQKFNLKIQSNFWTRFVNHI